MSKQRTKQYVKAINERKVKVKKAKNHRKSENKSKRANDEAKQSIERKSKQK